MKKLFAVVLTAMMLLSLCAFSSAENADLRIGVIQMADNGAFEDMRTGFIDRIKEVLGVDDSIFTCECAQGDASVLAQICDSMIENDMTLVATIATPPAQAFVNKESDIPLFFISVSNPVGAGIITDMAAPDKNATGTSNAIPVSAMFQLADTLTPGCKTYGLIYCPSEANSVSTANNAKEYMDANGLTYVEAIVTSSGEVQQAAESLVQKVDAIFVPNDSVVQTAMTVLAEIARDAAIPVYGSSAVMVNSGAFATISISDYAIGQITADMAIQYLKDGTPVERIPSVVVDQFTTVINQTTAEAIGAEISDDILNDAATVIVP